MTPIRISDLLMETMIWKFVGFVSSLVGLLCYALSSSFEHLFGEWNLLKILVYAVLSFIICSIMLFAKKRQLSRSFLLKAHVGFLVLMITSLYSFFYDKALNGKPDVLSLVSSGAFALMSLSLSRQIDLGFELGVFNFFAGCLTVQLMKVNLFLAFVAAVFCYSLIVLRSYLDSHPEIGSVRNQDHVVVDMDRGSAVERGSDNDNRQESTTLRKRKNVSQRGDSDGLEEEVESLKRDKNVLMQEIVRLRQHQQSSQQQLMAMESKLLSAYKNHEMLNNLFDTMNNPSFTQEFVQRKEIRRKRRPTGSPSSENVPSEPAMGTPGQKQDLATMIMNQAGKLMMLLADVSGVFWRLLILV